jgi:hypothetical protein
MHNWGAIGLTTSRKKGAEMRAATIARFAPKNPRLLKPRKARYSLERRSADLAETAAEVLRVYRQMRS